jgi:hypothetical protein
MEICHGWYSAKAAKQVGDYQYRTPGGETVVVTDVTSDDDGPSTVWGDEVYVGVVSEFVSRRPAHPLE